MSSAKGKNIILSPGGVWKWSYSSNFSSCGNNAANLNYWLFLGTILTIATIFLYNISVINESKNCDDPWTCYSSGYRKYDERRL